MYNVTTNSDEVSRALSRLASREIPYALKEGINTLAKGILKEEQAKMRTTFDRPTPWVLNGLRVTKWAKKTSLEAEVGYKEAGGATEKAVTPHVPGFPSERRYKGSEKWLQHAGFMQRGEFLVPSRTMKLDQYGNVPAHVMTKMLQDVGGYRNAKGFEATTKRGKKLKQTKAKYIFGSVRGTSGRLVKGIWLVEGGRDNMQEGRWHLQMLVVRKPHYKHGVIFPFWEIADRYAEKHLSSAVGAAVQKALDNPRK